MSVLGRVRQSISTSTHRRGAAAVAVGLSALALGATSADAATNRAPIGHLDSVTAVPGGVLVRGWTLDPDSTGSINVRVTTGTSTAFVAPAHDFHPGVNAVYPQTKGLRGFTSTIATPTGSVPVCASGLDSAGGASGFLGCATVNVAPNHPAIGAFDSVSNAGNGHVLVKGWAADTDTPSATSVVKAYLGGTPATAFTVASIPAALSRPDVAAAYPALGANHGFAASIAARPGTYPVCLYVLNATATDPTAGATSLGCGTVTI